MLRHILLFSILIISSIAYSQTKQYEAPDYKMISKNIENRDSEFYYPKLMDKLKASDTLITEEQYNHFRTTASL